ncbi:MAG: sigma-70 family RNA polymerase sigma factor [Verrucomicrobiaceae bacterium]|nr:sigma-70 family RNA polymerase sigma factor [Verrucomicrobiaceae bacterium]
MLFRKKDDPAELQVYVKLMTKHQGNLRAFIISLMPGSPDVADVLQEANAVLWQKRDRFEHGTNFLAWAFKIARYEVLRQRDRTKRDHRLEFSDKLVDALAEMVPPEESDEEVMSALDGCLAKLKKEQRQLVEARYTPGRSLEQQAEQIGSSPGSLRVALHRIRADLKHCIELTLANRSA